MLNRILARRRLRLSVVAAVALAGCGQASDPVQQAVEAASRKVEPADPALAEVYNRSCRSCHTIAATTAPLSGDAGAWSVRMDKGMDTLIDNVVNGFGGMPPFGMCMDCEVEDFEALIEFMSQPATTGADADA